MFLNEYNTIKYPLDKEASAANYTKKLQGIISYPGNANLSAGIGLQGHFGSSQPNLAYIRSTLDMLGATEFPYGSQKWMCKKAQTRASTWKRY
ncbi:hypothetical protein CerSpe_283480 [Prunus speciosa]